MDNSGWKTIYNSKKKRDNMSLYLVIVVFCTLFLFIISNKSLAQGQVHKAPVVVSRIVRKDVRKPVTMVSTVFPLRESIVAGEVEGLVVEFPAKRGDYVTKGQVLAKLRTTTLEIQLKGAKADEHLARIKYQRAMELYEGKTISHQELDEFETRLVAQEAVVEAIEDDIGKCTIAAPFDGRITEESTEVGQWLKKGDSVVSMLQMNSVKVRVPVPEKYIQGLSVGDESNVRFPALGDLTRAGHIVHIVPQADKRARTFPVFVKIDNKDEAIKSGMFAEATFEIGSLLSATMILKDGVVRRGGGEFIYLAVDGKVREVPVKTGIAYKNLIQITGDVKPGVDVIVRGNERVRNTQDIQVIGRMDIGEIDDREDLVN
ncbi:secretion protein HlyD [Candidatus Scalindua japonica]|uniref:Secretion protein HlyD n=1 Tax=Candidatus Scalindua japonica TaxID=1284222 RepID=A0A286U3Q6_9BACT|nr:efflux RND transporter periplasmic adaptor subunit [Candidatus Scalindua japonica]GAX62755.1 secretion protein HlyD [Candidatus Scalindua japonica]